MNIDPYRIVELMGGVFLCLMGLGVLDIYRRKAQNDDTVPRWFAWPTLVIGCTIVIAVTFFYEAIK